MYVGQTYDANVDQSILTYYETTKKSYDSVQPQ